jgi:hypothetical protein
MHTNSINLRFGNEYVSKLQMALPSGAYDQSLYEHGMRVVDQYRAPNRQEIAPLLRQQVIIGQRLSNLQSAHASSAAQNNPGRGFDAVVSRFFSGPKQAHYAEGIAETTAKLTAIEGQLRRLV